MNPSVIHTSRQAIRTFSYVWLPVIGGMLFLESGASAQVISAGDETNTTVTVVGEQFDITGGQSSADNANTFHNFEQFDLTAEQTANFITSTDVQNVIGRINSDQYSSINGTLQVSGSEASLYLINPSGMLLGPEAQLNLSGGFTATTANGIGFEDDQFATAATTDYNNFNGDPTAFRFETQQPSAVVNAGELSVETGQSLSLIGSSAVNTGTMNAPDGSVTVAAVAGESLVRISQGNQLLSVEIAPVEVAAVGSSPAGFGEMLTGGQLTSATTLITNADGTISLGTERETLTESDRTIGNGTALVAGEVSTRGDTGGNIDVLGSSVLLNNATLNASGNYGGGLVRVGGDYKGQGSVPNALETTVDEGSTLSADALVSGDGGNIFVWADETTNYSGHLSARGGTASGNGGLAEVSGKSSLIYEGSVDLSSPEGNVGTLLLDPENVEITDNTVLDSTALHLTSAAVENIFNTSNLEISASNNIIIHDVSEDTISISQGRAMTFVADSDNDGTGEFRTGAGDRLIAPEGTVSIDGASISVGSIETSTSKVGSNSGDAGDILLSATGDITARSLLSFSSTDNNFAGTGGAVQVNSERGVVNIANIDSFSSALGRGADAAGAVDISGDSVVLGDVNARSQSGDRDSGAGGNITITARSGAVNITGNVLSSSSAGEENSGSGGNITINAVTDVTVTGNLDSRSEAEEAAGAGGAIMIETTGDVTVEGSLISRSVAADEESGNAGAITVIGENVAVNVIDASSKADEDSGNAGIVSLTSATRTTVNRGIDATSTSDGNSADVFLVGRLIDLLNGPVSGNDVWFDTPSPTQDITVGLISGGTPALDIFKRELDNIGTVNTIRIGRAEGTNTITITDYAVDSASRQNSIVIAGGSTLIGPNLETGYSLTGSGTGSITTAGNIDSPNISFSNIENIVAGNRDDTFLVSPGVSLDDFNSLSGGVGANTIDYTAFVGTPLVVDFGTLTLQNIQRIEGPAAVPGIARTLLGSDSNNTWIIDGPNSGLLNTSVFNNFDTLTGGSLGDDFSFVGNGSIDGSIIGGSGINRLIYAGYDSAISLTVDGQSGTGLDNFSDIQSVVGSRNTDTIVGTSDDDTFEITAEHTGIVNSTLTFSDIEDISGEGGNNTLDYSQFDERVTVDAGLMTASGISSFSDIKTVVGSRLGDDRLIGTADDDDFLVRGDRTGTLNGTLNFSAIEILNGSTGNDAFSLDGFGPDNVTPISNLVIEGGSDLANGQSQNRLTTDSTSTTWQISGKNEGTLLDTDGNAIAAFNEIQQIENTSTTGAIHTVRFEQFDSQLTGGIDSGDRDLLIVGNDMNIGEGDGSGNNVGGRIAGSGRLTIRPENESVEIVIGGVDTQGPVLNITAGEIAAIQDGFEDIRIGEDTHTGGITLDGDVAFRDSVRLRSQGDIDTSDGELRVSNGRLSIETEGAILSDRLVSQTRDVTLKANDNITTGSITAGGGQGISITSNNGSITANSTLNTGGGAFGDNVLLSASDDVRVGDIMTSGELHSGDVTIRTEQGSITAGGITTANNIVANGAAQENAGNVLLESPNNIEIEFIDARGNGFNSEASGINITTGDTFRATGTIDRPELSNLITGENLTGGASISTVGARAGNVQIEYGRSDLTAMRFTVGNSEINGSALRIETPQTAILSGDFLGSYTQENINLVNRGILPTVITAPTPPTTVSRINFVETDILPTAIDLVFVTEDDTSEHVFMDLEGRNGEAFGEYLGIEERPVVTLQTAQAALRKIAATTETTPAVLYVYFVPDAASIPDLKNPTESLSDERARPNDQLEIMVMTGNDEPIKRRQWGITRAQVEAANQQLRQQATSQFSPAQQYLSPAQQLYRWIVQPIADTLEQQNINSLGFVMDSSLRTMPIAALHDGQSFLVENYSLGVLPSFSLANIHSTVSDSRTDYSQERVLAMGASEFNNQPDLPAVSAEIELISQGLGEGDAFLNEEFVLETLQAQLKKEDYGIVHLATHAVFEPGDLQQSYIQLWNEQLSLAELGNLQLSEEEISLMILSACSTALGDRASEYGFAGLAVSAGSEAALASIWPVSDEGTLGFMTQFYEDLRDTSVRAEALRQTQLQMLSGEIGISDGIVYGPNGETLANLPALAESGRWDFSHPFYWSPFTMIGNPW